mmetsp:Transcript_52704/g.149408  ORF Transcript_52704/g.149408 Transcript_52704/m.149408 type:complete len:217 (+) Transcript_52704:223-873(+)
MRSLNVRKAAAWGSSIARPKRHLKSAGCLRGSSSRSRSPEKTGDSRRCTSWSNCRNMSSDGSKTAMRVIISTANSYCWAQRQSARALTGLKNQGSRRWRKRGLAAAALPVCAAWQSRTSNSERGRVLSNSSRKLFVSTAVSRIQLKVCTSCCANSRSWLLCWMNLATVTYKCRLFKLPQRCRIMAPPLTSSISRRSRKSSRSRSVESAKRSRPSGP